MNHKILHHHSDYNLEDADILSHISPHTTHAHEKYITHSNSSMFSKNNTSTLSTHSTQSQSQSYNSSIDTSKRLLNSKTALPNTPKSDRSHCASHIPTNKDSFAHNSNDSFESKINYFESNNSNEVKDELMITLNPQKFKYDLWSDERRDTYTHKGSDIVYKPSIVNRNECYELSPSKQLSSIFGTNVVNPKSVNVKQNRNSRNSNRKIINCTNTKDNKEYPNKKVDHKESNHYLAQHTDKGGIKLSNMSNVSGINDNKDGPIPAQTGANIITPRNYISLDNSSITANSAYDTENYNSSS